MSCGVICIVTFRAKSADFTISRTSVTFLASQRMSRFSMLVFCVNGCLDTLYSWFRVKVTLHMVSFLSIFWVNLVLASTCFCEFETQDDGSKQNECQIRIKRPKIQHNCPIMCQGHLRSLPLDNLV